MAGVMFTIILLAILIAVGFVFAWMVQLMSEPENHAMAVVPIEKSR